MIRFLAAATTVLLFSSVTMDRVCGAAHASALGLLPLQIEANRVQADQRVQATFAGGTAGLGDGFIAKINAAGVNAGTLSVVSAASFSGDTVAPDSIVAAFGQGLATDLFFPNSGEFPTALGGVSIKATDSAGVDRVAALYFVSPGQINFVMPASMAPGTAQITELRNGA